MPFGEVESIRKLDYLTQEVGTRSKAFYDAGDLLPSRSGTPEVISGSRVPGSFVIRNDPDLGFGLIWAK